MHNYYILSLNDKVKWKEYLSKFSPELYDIYFTPDYLELYQNLGDGKVQCFVYQENNNIALYPFLINGTKNINANIKKEYFDIVSIYGYNGIISNNEDPNFIKNFHQKFNFYCTQNNIIAEFYRFHPFLHNEKLNIPSIEVSDDRNTVAFDFRITNDFRNLYSKNTRRDLNIAKKFNLTTEIIKNDGFKINEFIEIYNENMNRVNSSEYLYFNKNYFKELFRLNEVVQFIVKSDDKIISSSICFVSNNYMHYHLGCSLNNYLNMCPNNLLLDSMLEYASQNEIKILYLGGGTSSSENDSLLKFKQKFGNTFLKYKIGKRIINKEIYSNLVLDWEENNVDKVDLFKNYFYKYRK